MSNATQETATTAFKYYAAESQERHQITECQHLNWKSTYIQKTDVQLLLRNTVKGSICQISCYDQDMEKWNLMIDSIMLKQEAKFRVNS